MIYSPSQVLTDFLSKYLIFDISQLQIGIWRGDLQIKDVNLRREAFLPILNPTYSWNKTPSDERTPQIFPKGVLLHLLCGSVGQLNVLVPWVLFVKGQGRLEVELTDLDIIIVLSDQTLESEGEDDCDSKKNYARNEDVGDFVDMMKKSTEEKQRLIREAEKCLLNKQPIPPPKDSRDQHEETISNDIDALDNNKKGFIERLMTRFSSSIMWTIFRGLHVRIKNLKITFVVDEIEIGITIDSLSLGSSSSFDISILPSACAPDVDNTQMDADSLPKHISVNDLGVYIRSLNPNDELYEESFKDASDGSTTSNRLSHISTMDYVLKPLSATFALKLFNQKKVKSTESLQLSLRQQQKHNKIKSKSDDLDSILGREISYKEYTESPLFDNSVEAVLNEKIESSVDFVHLIDEEEMFEDAQEEIKDEEGPLLGFGNAFQVKTTDNTEPSNSSFHVSSVHNSTSLTAAQIPSEVALYWSLDIIEITMCRKRYRLLSRFTSTVYRIKNGRPQIAIDDVLKHDSCSHDFQEKKQQFYEDDIVRPPINEVVKKWWKYAYINVVRELRERKEVLLRHRCPDTYVSKNSFLSRTEQRNKYIQLYKKVYLNGNLMVQSIESDLNAQKLVEIEDTLFVEQIMLYRAIARSDQFGVSSKKKRNVDISYSKFLSPKVSSETISKKLKKGTRQTYFHESDHGLKKKMGYTTKPKASRTSSSSSYNGLNVSPASVKPSRTKSKPEYFTIADANGQSNPVVFDQQKSMKSNGHSNTSYIMSGVLKKINIIICAESSERSLDNRFLCEQHNFNSGTKKKENTYASCELEYRTILVFSISSIHTNIHGESFYKKQVYLDIGSMKAIGLGGQVIFSSANSFRKEEFNVTSEKRQQHPSELKNNDRHATNIDMLSLEDFDVRHSCVSTHISTEVQTCGAKLLKCNVELSKSSLTIETKTAAALLNFFRRDGDSLWPTSILPPVNIDQGKLLFEEYKTSGRTDDGSEYFFCLTLRGLDVLLPIQDELDFICDDSACKFSEDIEEIDASSLKLFFQSVVFSFGNVFPFHQFGGNFDLKSVDSPIDQESKGNGHNRGCVNSRTRGLYNKVKHLEVYKLFADSDRYSNHALFMIHGVYAEINKRQSNYPLLKQPFDIEAILHGNQVSRLNLYACRNMVLSTSPIDVIMSHNRVLCLGNLALRQLLCSDGKDVLTSNKEKNTFFFGSVLAEVNASIKFVRMCFVLDSADDDNIKLNDPRVRAIMVEESLSDFISQYACFDMKYSPQESIESIIIICRDRLSNLGIPNEDAEKCIEDAIESFSSQLHILKKAEQQVISDLDVEDEPNHFHENLRDESNDPELENAESNLLETIIDDAISVTSGQSCESDANTEESFQIIETAMNFAVEISMNSLLQTLGEVKLCYNNEKEIFVVDIVSSHIILRTWLDEIKIYFFLESFSARNSAGVTMVQVKADDLTCKDGRLRTHSNILNSHDIGENGNSETSWLQTLQTKENFFDKLTSDFFDEIISNGGRTFGMLLSSYQLSKSKNLHQHQSQSSRFHLENVDILFVADDWIKVVDHVISMFVVSGLGIEKKKSKHVEVIPNHHVVAGSMLKWCTVLASDSLAPFLKVDLETIKVRRSSVSVDKQTLVIESTSIQMSNLTPEGQFYFNVVSSSLGSEKSAADANFHVEFNSYANFWEHSPELSIIFRNVHFCLLRQLLNEFLQYLLNPMFGFGKLITKFFGEVVNDSAGNPPPPLIYRISLADSVILLPRNSESTEMIALTFDEVSLFRTIEDKTWKIPQDEVQSTSAFYSNSTTTASKQESFPEVKEISLKQSDTNVECLIDDDETFYETFESFSDNSIFVDLKSDAIEVRYDYDDLSRKRDCARGHEDNLFSSFHKDMISRINVQGQSIRLFTAIGSKCYCKQNDSPHLFFYTKVSEKVVEGGSVYILHKEYPNEEKKVENKNWHILAELLDRRWEEVSSSQFDLEVMVDYSPHLRILINNNSINGSKANPLSLNMSMSKFYLCLSVWYSNMQEMPISYPYNEDDVKKLAMIGKIPEDWPEYGTQSWVERMERMLYENLNFELALDISEINFECYFNDDDYFEKAPLLQFLLIKDIREEKKSLPVASITLKNVVMHVIGDIEDTLRMGLGATDMIILDSQCRNTSSKYLIEAKLPATCNEIRSKKAWADFKWGLRCGKHTLIEGLRLPLQLSLFMTPDGWCNMNLGINNANAVIPNLVLIWNLIDYFGLYFQSKEFGHPFFVYETQKDNLKSHKSFLQKRKMEKEEANEDVLNLDVRLWFCEPCLLLPVDQDNSNKPWVLLESEEGFFYRFRSIGEDFSSQEFCGKDMGISLLKRFISPEYCRSLQRLSRIDHGVESVVERFTSSIKYDYNSSTNFSKLVVNMPLSETDFKDALNTNGLDSPDPVPKRLAYSQPTIVGPERKPSRSLGKYICDITGNLNSLKQVVTVLSCFTSSPENPELEPMKEPENPIFDIVVSVKGVRFLLSDVVLGAHLPLAILCIPSLKLNASQLSHSKKSDTDDQQIGVDINLLASYWNMNLKCWEPLVEPYRCLILYEKSWLRGKGITVHSQSPFHINVSNSMLETFDQAVTNFATSKDEKMESSNIDEESVALKKDDAELALQRPRHQSVKEIVGSHENQVLKLEHRKCSKIASDDRVAFSLLNLTGERIRLNQHSNIILSKEIGATLTYLDHCDRTKLNFEATMSVPINLSLVEVPFHQGMCQDISRQQHGESQYFGKELDLSIDVQIPGFKWLLNVGLDTVGRSFHSLESLERSTMQKLEQNWRLKNAAQLVTETFQYNGGRQISIKSVFEVINKTSHAINMVIHPDPTFSPLSNGERLEKDDVSYITDHGSIGKSSFQNNGGNGIFERLEAGESYHVPILLLLASLRLKGNHLGSVWISPVDASLTNNSIQAGLGNSDMKQPHNGSNRVAMSSRPIQFAKLVHQSSILFCGNPSDEVAGGSGLQISCPVLNANEDSVSPFCYVVEIRRSIFPKANNTKSGLGFEAEEADDVGISIRSPYRNSHHDSSESIEQLYKDKKSNGKQNFRKNPPSCNFHAPVMYSLFVHPPIIMENLLCESGTFELMHAARKDILWSATLEPGESLPIHTVGLDSPLILMLHLGYCRTPHGNGALVHDGRTYGKGLHESNQGALKKSRKQRIKRRPHLDNITTNGAFVRSSKNDGESESLGLDTGHDFTGDLGGSKIGSEESRNNFNEIATEIFVVDSLGQRLSLSIENVIGLGGQRRISVFCPFWILNLTQHSLKYRHESSSAFVSGTVLSNDKDGSKPVDGSYINQKSFKNKGKSGFLSSPEVSTFSATLGSKRGTIFAGTKGALAGHTRPFTLEEITSIMSPEKKIGDISALCFMFNFHESAQISQRKLCFQVSDSKYTSNWSGSLSLESVGVTQIVGMHCKDGRALELAVVVNVGTGALSRFTKIVRIYPRYVLVNQLNRPLRLWQHSSLVESNFSTIATGGRGESMSNHHVFSSESSNASYDYLFSGISTVAESKGIGMNSGTLAHLSALHITTAGQSECKPFFLPDTRKDRQLRIDFGDAWILTSSFPADITGDYFLQAKRFVDPTHLDHVSTRASPQYEVILPPVDSDGSTSRWDGELGIWFETAWGQREILVKGTKEGKFCFNNTDIHNGDQLLKIDGLAVGEFTETMKMLRERVAFIAENRGHKKTNSKALFSTISKNFLPHKHEITSQKSQTLVLTFRTLEERMRRVRKRAKEKKKYDQYMERNDETLDETKRVKNNIETSRSRSENITVQMKLIYQSIFLFVGPFDTASPPYRIDNQAISHTIYFRQRNCDGHQWHALNPGESTMYIWEEPMKPKKLSIRAAIDPNLTQHLSDSQKQAKKDMLFGSENKKTREKSDKKKFQEIFHFVDNEEQGFFGPTRTVKLEEIGFTDELPCPLHSEPGKVVAMNEHGKTLKCRIDTEGGTRVLIISEIDKFGHVDELASLHDHLNTLRYQIRDEEAKLSQFKDMTLSLQSSYFPSNADPSFAVQKTKDNTLIEDKLKFQTRSDDKEEMPPLLPKLNEHLQPLNENNAVNPEMDNLTSLDEEAMCSFEDKIKYISDYPEGITINGRNQVCVQVLQAAGLKFSDSINGLSNPFCEVSFRQRSRNKHQKIILKSRKKRKTYFVEKTNDPKWSGQSFVFQVPHDAVEISRGYCVEVKVYNFSRMNNTLIGQISIQLQSLRSQEEVEGWYPLTGRIRGEIPNSSINDVRGSIRLRLQWIYSVPALLGYYLNMSSNRLQELKRSKKGMETQLSVVRQRTKEMRKLKSPRIPLSIHNDVNDKLQKNYFASSEWGAAKTRQKTKPKVSIPAWKRRLNREGRNPQEVLQFARKVVRKKLLSTISVETEEIREIRRQFLDPRLSSPSLYPHLNSGSDNDFKSSGIQKNSVGSEIKQFAEIATKNQNDSSLPEDLEMAFKNDISYFRPRTFSDVTSRQSLLRGGSRKRLFSSGDGDFDSIMLSSFVKQRSQIEMQRRPSIEIFSQSQSELEAMSNAFLENSTSRNDVVQSRSDPKNDGGINSMNNALQRDTIANNFYMQGFFYRKSASSNFHRHHLTHRIREDISLAHSGKNFDDIFLKIPLSINLFKSWTLVQLFVNDDDVSWKFLKQKPMGGGSTNTNKLKNGPSCLTHHLQYLSNDSKTEQYSMTISTAMKVLGIPKASPMIVKEKMRHSAETLSKCRHTFSKAANSSKNSAINLGGTLVIRPITALNISSGNHGMYVKLNYGQFVQKTNSVEAKVAPQWSPDEEIDPIMNSNEGISSPRFSCSEDEDSNFSNLQFENDFQIHVHSLQTSGSLYLSVCEERLQSDVERGILHIPIGAAIKCCNECISAYKEKKKKEITPLGTPLYTRWFPLMSPKDFLPIEGGMGLNGQPPESEKSSDQSFSQRYFPCIKLTFMWKPVEDVGDSDNDKYNEDLIHDENKNSTYDLRHVSHEDNPCRNELIKENEFLNYFQADIRCFSMALIDSYQGQELLSFCAKNLDIRYAITSAKTRMGFVIGWLQLDHQAQNPREPVVLSPALTIYPQPTVQILAVKDDERSKSNVISFDFVGMALQELNIRIEESWLFGVWKFIFESINRYGMQKKSTNALLGKFFGGAVDTDTSSRKEGKKVYIELLELGSIKLNLSYIKSRSAFSEQYMEDSATVLSTRSSKGLDAFHSRINIKQQLHKYEISGRVMDNTSDEDMWTEDEGKYSNSLPNIVSAVFPSITDAPVRLQLKTLKHVFETVDEIGESLKSFYTAEILRQIYKIVGSLDFVGNPTMALNSIMTGVRDFFTEPSRALLRSHQNPSELGMGVVRGTLSLVSNSASGVFGFASKMSANVGHAAATLSMDKSFQLKHAEAFGNKSSKRNTGSKQMLMMSARPFQDICNGIVGAATGILVEPYKGAKKGGSRGLAKGVAIGSVGIVAKPLVGIFDAFAHAAESIQHVAKSVNILEKKYVEIKKLRLSYVFGINNLLSPFDPVAARSVQLIKNVDAGKRFDPKNSLIRQQEYYIIAEALRTGPSQELYLVVTSKRLLIFDVKKENGEVNQSTKCIISFDKNTTLTSCVENRGHNAVAMMISISHVKKKDDESSMSAVDSFRHLNSMNILTKENSRVDSIGASTPSSIIARRIHRFEQDDLLDETQSGSKMHGKSNNKDSYGKKYTVAGEFQHRPQLARIHNVICCLFNNFENIIYESSVSSEGGDDGFIKFGHMRFQKGDIGLTGDSKKFSKGSKQRLDDKNMTKFLSLVANSGWLLEDENNDLFLNNKRSVKHHLKEGNDWLETSFMQAIAIKPSSSSSRGKGNDISNIKGVNKEDNRGNLKGGKERRNVPAVVNELASTPALAIENAIEAVLASAEAPTETKRTPDTPNSNLTSKTLQAYNDRRSDQSYSLTHMSTSETILHTRLDKVEMMLERLLSDQNDFSNARASGSPSETTGLSIISSLGDHGVEDDKIDAFQRASSRNLDRTSKEILIQEINQLHEELAKYSSQGSYGRSFSDDKRRSFSRKQRKRFQAFAKKSAKIRSMFAPSKDKGKR